MQHGLLTLYRLMISFIDITFTSYASFVYDWTYVFAISRNLYRNILIRNLSYLKISICDSTSFPASDFPKFSVPHDVKFTIIIVANNTEIILGNLLIKMLLLSGYHYWFTFNRKAIMIAPVNKVSTYGILLEIYCYVNLLFFYSFHLSNL